MQQSRSQLGLIDEVFAQRAEVIGKYPTLEFAHPRVINQRLGRIALSSESPTRRAARAHHARLRSAAVHRLQHRKHVARRERRDVGLDRLECADVVLGARFEQLLDTLRAIRQKPVIRQMVRDTSDDTTL